MNKRIQKLFNEAGFHQPEMERLGIEDKFEKFAELIVRECADVCYNHDDVERFGIYPVRVAMVTKACSENIKKHFGVEE